MTRIIALCAMSGLLLSLWAHGVTAGEPAARSHATTQGSGSAPPAVAPPAGARGHRPAEVHGGGTDVIDVNRPRSPFDCDLPIGVSWYGSTARCLAELCGGQNVYNEYVFDADNRRRRNPCYGQNPTEFPGD